MSGLENGFDHQILQSQCIDHVSSFLSYFTAGPRLSSVARWADHRQ
jgi:hypothetical protein